MSVDVIQTVSIPPHKRLCYSSSTLTDINISKCGEVFVSDCANVWTFHCSYCQLSTTDIGVFFCHVRLEHLFAQTAAAEPKQQCNTSITIASSRQNVTVLTPPPPVTSIMRKNLPSTEIITAEPAEQVQREIIKVEEPNVAVNQTNRVYDINELTQLDGNNKTSTLIDVKIPLVKYDQPNVNEIVDVFYINNVDNDDDDDDKIPLSADEEHNNDDYNENNYDHENSADDDNQNYPYHCDICNKGFRTKHGMKGHSRLHQANKQKQCSVCLSLLDGKYFVTHVMSHESETCFPCQVCGVISDSQEKRLNHWRNHEEMLPFVCSYCYRRFKKERYLTKHLQCHKRLECEFCKVEFYSKNKPRHLPPYACGDCMTKPELRNSVKKIRRNEKLHDIQRQSEEEPLKNLAQT